MKLIKFIFFIFLSEIIKFKSIFFFLIEIIKFNPFFFFKKKKTILIDLIYQRSSEGDEEDVVV